MLTPLESMGKFKTVVIDPPWNIAMGPVLYKREKSQGISQESGGSWDTKMNYKPMDFHAIATLPINQLLEGDAFVFCWTVNSMLAQTFSLIETWGCKYSFTMTWAKQRGPQFPGKPCFNAEWIVVGRQGNPKFLDTRAFRTANFWKSTGHSEKPDGFYNLLRRVTPEPRLDIFSRRLIPGFSTWGRASMAPKLKR